MRRKNILDISSNYSNRHGRKVGPSLGTPGPQEPQDSLGHLVPWEGTSTV